MCFIMKNLVYVMLALVAISFASCHTSGDDKTDAAPKADTVMVDTTAQDAVAPAQAEATAAPAQDAQPEEAAQPEEVAQPEEATK